MINPNSNPVYSRKWACEVVSSFQEKYSRATTILAIGCGISRDTLNETLISSVRTNQLRWKSLKIMIKLINRDEGLQQILQDRRLTVEQRTKYLTYMKYLAEDLAIDDENTDKTVQLYLDY